MSNARYAFTASLLANGSVLVTGGAQQPNSDANWTNSDVLASCEIYTNGTWYPTGSLNYARADHQVCPWCYADACQQNGVPLPPL